MFQMTEQGFIYQLAFFFFSLFSFFFFFLTWEKKSNKSGEAFEAVRWPITNGIGGQEPSDWVS